MSDVCEGRVPDDGFLHVWECPASTAPGDLCGYIQGGPGDGYCPYDHPERVKLVEIVAVVQCSDCGAPILRHDSRAPDGRLICDTCVFGYLGAEEL